MLAGQLPYFISMGIYLYTLRPLLAGCVLLLAIPVFITQLIQVKMFGKMEDEVSPARRRNAYFDRCISDREYFKETRLLGAYTYFFGKYTDSLQEYCRATARTEKRSNRYMIISRVVTLAGYVGVLFLLFFSLMDGYITVGAFAAVFASITDLLFSLMEFFDKDFKSAIRSFGAVGNFIGFVDHPQKTYSPVSITRRGDIHLENVHFTYPGAPGETIRGVTLSITPGETLAVVGEKAQESQH